MMLDIGNFVKSEEVEYLVTTYVGKAHSFKKYKDAVKQYMKFKKSSGIAELTKYTKTTLTLTSEHVKLTTER